MTDTAYSVINGCINEVGAIIEDKCNVALTGARHTIKFKWHDPRNQSRVDIHTISGTEAVRLFDFGIPQQVDVPFTGANHDWQVYDIPLTIVYPNQMEWSIRCNSDHQLIKKQCESNTNALSVSGCQFRQLSEKYTVNANPNGSLYLETSFRIYAELDT